MRVDFRVIWDWSLGCAIQFLVVHGNPSYEVVNVCISLFKSCSINRSLWKLTIGIWTSIGAGQFPGLWQVMHTYPDNKVHGANMGSTWVLLAPDGPHISPMNLVIRVSEWEPPLYQFAVGLLTHNNSWNGADRCDDGADRRNKDFRAMIKLKKLLKDCNSLSFKVHFYSFTNLFCFPFVASP